VRSAAAPDAAGPLSHLRVLDLSRLYPGALCSLLLADLGADVVKIEVPGTGDGLRFVSPGDFLSAHMALNRGKRSVQLDLRHPRAAEVLRGLVRDVDVVIDSNKPGVLDRSGLGYQAMREENPRLIWCSITGFGPDGPHQDQPGHDITYLGYSGLLSELEVDGMPPVTDVVVSVPVAALMSVTGILAAVAERDRTGVGAKVDASMVDSAMWLLSENVARAASAPGPVWPSLAARGVYRCADGKLITLAATEPKPWSALCKALEVPDLADYRLGVDEDATRVRLAEVFATQPAAYWTRAPGLAGGVGPVNTADDLVDDEHVTAREGLVTLDGTDIRVLANPLRFDLESAAEGTRATAPPPELGEHTDAVLAAAGFTTEQVESLRADGAI